MPQYRIEISPNNRAGCKDTVCKKEGIKILKGEVRFGTWVEIEDHGSWSWKHWGCVSGQQMERLHDACEDGDDFNFDEIDGYDEITDDDVLEKIRRCVKQAHIDPEDFKGDPEKNVPGAVGIRLTATQLRAKEKAAAEAEDGDAPKKGKKRARKAADNDNDDDAPIKKTKKAKASKVKDEEDDDEPPAKTKKTASKAKSPAKAPAKAPAKKASKKAAVKDEDSESEEKPQTKSRRGRARAAKA